jgi:deaminated glutathione amidase
MGNAQKFRAACLQLNAGNDLEANLSTLRVMLRQAAQQGAHFVLTPEYALMLDGSGRVMRERALDADGGAPLRELKTLARELGIWLLIGSLTVRSDQNRMANRSILLSSEGLAVATYDKIHMFDATLPDGKTIRESSAYLPGEHAVTADTPWGKIGLTVCYDLRFPGLFRSLAQAGASFISVPSSFQRQTGRDHWHALIRARAIENGCFILAPAMCGDHPGNRQTYGHSMIVDPWGTVIAEAGEEEGIVYADIDTDRVAAVRSMLPSLEHDRPYSPPATAG